MCYITILCPKKQSGPDGMVQGLSYMKKRENNVIQCYYSHYNMNDFPAVLLKLKQTNSIPLIRHRDQRNAYLPV